MYDELGIRLSYGDIDLSQALFAYWIGHCPGTDDLFQKVSLTLG